MSAIHFLQRFIFVTLLICVIGFPISSAQAMVGEEEPENYTQASIIADKTQVSGNESVRLGLKLNIHPKWHVYWINPGDSGLPPSIKWNLPKNFTTTELEFPTPKKLPFGPLTNYGHEDEVIFLQNLYIPANLGNTPFRLDAKVNLLVCHEICIPEDHDVSIILNGGQEPQASLIQAAEKKLPTTIKNKATFREENGNFVVEIVKSDYKNIKNVTLFPADWGAVDNNKSASHQHAENNLIITQARGDRSLSELSEIPFVLKFDTNDGQSTAISLTAYPDKGTISDGKTNVTSIDISSLVRAVLFALLGGLILNLMPCVFPVLAMKALSLVGIQNKEEQKARGYGLSYTAGILLSFAFIGGTLLALRAAGEQIGWGFQLQSPIIIVLLTYLVFLVGLNFSGLFELTGRFGNIGNKLTQASGNRGAFFTGVLATLVATPCTAPFMGAAMGFALTQPAYISMLVFLALGFGLALPYLALCFIPALRSKLPKAGNWMETFRQFLAFPMFITTAWLVWVLSQQINSISVFCVLLSLIAIVFVIWLCRVLPQKGVGKILSLVLITASLGFIISSAWITSKNIRNSSSFMQLENNNWEEFTPRKLVSLLEETNEPVFTNMTAAWCITCKVNEKVALSTDKAKELFEEQNVQYLKGDWTNQNPDITKYLNSFDRQGVPLYVYYGPRDDQTKTRPEPVVLPQILTPGLVVETIHDKS